MISVVHVWKLDGGADLNSQQAGSKIDIFLRHLGGTRREAITNVLGKISLDIHDGRQGLGRC